MNGKVSIIILVQDRIDFVRRCIDSVVDNTFNSDYELVIIRQGSISPALVNYLYDLQFRLNNEKETKIKIAINEHNTGVTPGRNQGIEMSSGDYFLFLDDDAFVENDLRHIPEEEHSMDWLERMTRYFKDNVGIVAQSGYYIDPKRKGIFFEVKSRGSLCDVGQGYCFMFSRDVVNSIGMLDPYFGKFWHEESEYALRAKANGFLVVGTMYIGVQHVGSGSGDDGTYAKKFEYMYNKWKDKFQDILVGVDNWK